jgi:plastocyanin
MFLRPMIVIVACLLSRNIVAGALDVSVRSGDGTPVADAVVFANPSTGAPVVAKKRTVIDQRDKQFVPYVTALQAGTAVVFPNSDNIRHHVYSFSPAKKFELPLYSGVPAEPVVFDKVGFVTLGCNIHDWMVAYVAVLPTPYFEVTRADGRGLLANVPAGQYIVQVWQPSLRGTPEQSAQKVDVSATATRVLTFTLDLKPDFRARRAPGLPTGGYR